MKQIRRALSELEDLGLVVIKTERVKAEVRYPGPVIKREKNFFAQKDIGVKEETLMSSSEVNLL